MVDSTFFGGDRAALVSLERWLVDHGVRQFQTNGLVPDLVLTSAVAGSDSVRRGEELQLYFGRFVGGDTGPGPGRPRPLGPGLCRRR